MPQSWGKRQVCKSCKYSGIEEKNYIKVRSPWENQSKNNQLLQNIPVAPPPEPLPQSCLLFFFNFLLTLLSPCMPSDDNSNFALYLNQSTHFLLYQPLHLLLLTRISSFSSFSSMSLLPFSFFPSALFYSYFSRLIFPLLYCPELSIHPPTSFSVLSIIF